MTDNCSIASTTTVGSPTIAFTEDSMVKLLTAYKSLRDLEKLLSMIAGIDPSNGFLSDLRHMDDLIQDLSPLYDPNLEYDEQVYTKILENDSLSIPVKAHILLGSRIENGISNIESESSAYEFIIKNAVILEDTMQRSSVFTVENMADLLTAYYGYFNLSEAINMFVGHFPNHKILNGLGHLENLLSDLSPLYHPVHDNDEIENANYIKVLQSGEIKLIEKARLLMNSSLALYQS